eukprot:jgi/Chrzof1/12961/Cz07g14040.t1
MTFCSSYATTVIGQSAEQTDNIGHVQAKMTAAAATSDTAHDEHCGRRSHGHLIIDGLLAHQTSKSNRRFLLNIPGDLSQTKVDADRPPCTHANATMSSPNSRRTTKLTKSFRAKTRDLDWLDGSAGHADDDDDDEVARITRHNSSDTVQHHSNWEAQVVEVLPSASAFAVNDVVVEGSAQMPRWQVPISSPQPPVQYSLSSKQMLIVDSPKSRSIARHTLNCSTTIMSALSRASSSDSELLVAAATSATSPGAGSSGTKPRRRTTPALDKSKVTDADIDDNPDAIDTARVVILRPGRRSSHNVTPRPKSCCSTPSVKQCLGSLTQRRDSQPDGLSKIKCHTALLQADPHSGSPKTARSASCAASIPDDSDCITAAGGGGPLTDGDASQSICADATEFRGVQFASPQPNSNSSRLTASRHNPSTPQQRVTVSRCPSAKHKTGPSHEPGSNPLSPAGGFRNPRRSHDMAAAERALLEPHGPVELDEAAPPLRGHRLGTPTLDDIDYILGRWTKRWEAGRLKSASPTPTAAAPAAPAAVTTSAFASYSSSNQVTSSPAATSSNLSVSPFAAVGDYCIWNRPLDELHLFGAAPAVAPPGGKFSLHSRSMKQQGLGA